MEINCTIQHKAIKFTPSFRNNFKIYVLKYQKNDLKINKGIYYLLRLYQKTIENKYLV